MRINKSNQFWYYTIRKEEGIFREDYLINGTKYYESNGKMYI